MAYQILSPADLKLYKSTEYEKLGDTYVLKAGVKPRGGVKTVQLATLYGPGGQKQVAVSGSTYATSLTDKGWGVTAGSYDVQVLRNLGFSDDTIKNLTDSQRNMFAALGKSITAQYDANKTVPPTFTAADLDRIMKEAQNDPNIDNYYKEQLRVGVSDFTRAVDSLGKDYNAIKAENERQFGFQRKDLSEAEAAAGRAYSGFREQAKTRLQGDQNNIIESSRRNLQKNVDTLGSSFEKTFGSSAVPGGPNLGLAGEAGADAAYNPTGGVAGTQENSRLVDTRQRYNDIIADETLSRGLGTGTGDVATPPTTTTTPGTSSAAPSTNTRAYWQGQGYVYVGTPAERDALIRQGKKVIQLQTGDIKSYFYKK